MTSAVYMRIRSIASRARRDGLSVAPAVTASILAWVLLAVLGTYGLHAGRHDGVVGLAIDLSMWLLMIIAMMLPANLGLLRLVRQAAAIQATRTSHSWRIVPAFLCAYLAIWLAFALALLTCQASVRWVAANVAMLEAKTSLAVVLSLAGAYQFTSLKARCLGLCRSPAAFFAMHYRKGAAGAMRLGWLHGLRCLGCCGALMLVMFAVGAHDLSWMIALSAATLLERLGANGERLRYLCGAALLAAALLNFGASGHAGH